MPTIGKRGTKTNKNLCKEGISWQGLTERKELAKLLAHERAIGPLLGFVKSTEVGGREGRELEWELRVDRAGEELLQNKSDSGGETSQMSRITPGKKAHK